MPPIISKIRLINYRRFSNYSITPNEKTNILVGDNEVGKSSILEAIDIVTSGNIRKVESIGIDKLLNMDAINVFQAGERCFKQLPTLIVELYLKGDFPHTMNGKNNTAEIICDGIRLICSPNNDYISEITESLQANDDYFPYDYYAIRFSTFADEAYTNYKKKIRSILIDSTNMSSEYATTDFIKRMYHQYTENNVKERAMHKSNYRQVKSSFCSDCFKALNERIPAEKDYEFGLKIGSSLSLENDMMIYENKVGIDSKGKGKQVFIKTDFALERSGSNVDVIMIEEPENHLSHVNLRNLIQRVSETHNGQLFITTHNSLVCTRLDLQNLLILHSGSQNQPTSLNQLNKETAKYFMKAPVANVIEFALSHKVILVEGPSEYMLFEKFYTSTSGNKPEADNVYIMDVRGLNFKRYLEISRLLGNKVAVVTDNDSDVKSNCIEKYSDFSADTNIEIFYEIDDKKRTFEIVLYEDNKTLCDRLFGVDAMEYMLKNKTEAAYALLTESTPITVPSYIKGAIDWIRK